MWFTVIQFLYCIYIVFTSADVISIFVTKVNTFLIYNTFHSNAKLFFGKTIIANHMHE